MRGAPAFPLPRDYDRRVTLVTLTVVPSELEAEMLCGSLRANGIECTYRKTDVAAGAYALTLGSGGLTEVLVEDGDLEAARTLI